MGMKIQNFRFSDYKQNLHIEEVTFDDLNLLVGASGVGKTRILRALDLIFDVAKGRNRKLNDLEWSIKFVHSNQKYKWDLKSSSSAKDALLSESEQFEIIFERLIRYEGELEIEIFHRTITDSKLNNVKLPKLKRTESAINLLSEEEQILPVSQAFKRFIFNETPQNITISISLDPDNISFENETNEMRFYRFKEESVEAPTVFKAFLLQKFFPDTFSEIKDYYIDIFPSVKNIRVSADKESQNSYDIFFEIEEYGSENWIPQQRISSGMFRTLTCLVEVLAAPEESVIVIDEFENSLGINCMPELTEFILDKSPGLQFILTSHHPYIINNIPWKTWHIVSRDGSKVRVRKATDIPELDTASSLDKFTQLIDLLECEESAA